MDAFLPSSFTSLELSPNYLIRSRKFRHRDGLRVHQSFRFPRISISEDDNDGTLRAMRTSQFRLEPGPEVVSERLGFICLLYP